MYINQAERDNLAKGLGIFIESFRFYIVSILIKRFGDDWDKEFSKTLNYKQKENWEKDLRKGIKPIDLIDFQYLKKIALDNRDLLEDDFGYEKNSLPTWLSEIYEARNEVAHYNNSLEETKAIKAWIHLREIARLIGNNELEQKLYNLQKNQNSDNPKRQTLKETFKPRLNFTQHSTETLDIVNCSGLWQEVFADEVYFCPAENGAYTHRQCKYFGAYFQKRVGAIGEIEAVIDIHSENEAEIYWINGNQNAEEYISRAREKAIELRPNDFPLRIFLLKDLYSIDFIKDSKGGMQASKMYLNVEGLNVTNAKELIEKLDGKNWSNFNL